MGRYSFLVCCSPLLRAGLSRRTKAALRAGYLDKNVISRITRKKANMPTRA
jgi:hypothetical protein